MPAPLLQGTRLSYTISPANDGTLLAVGVGELVIINVRWYSTGTINLLTVAGENATLLGTPQIGGPDNARSQWAIWWNTGAAGNKLVAAGITTGSGAVEAWRVSGADPTTPVVVRNGAAGNNTTPQVTLAGCPAECLGLAIGSSQGGDWASPSSPWTLITVTDAVWYDSGAQAADLGAAGDKTLSATIPSSSWGINAIAIQPPPPSGGVVTGAILLDDISVGGGFSIAPSVSMTGNVNLDDITVTGALSGSLANISFGPLRNWSGDLQASFTIPRVEVVRLSDGARIGLFSNVSVDASGNVLLPAVAGTSPGQSYLVFGWSLDGANFVTALVVGS